MDRGKDCADPLHWYFLRTPLHFVLLSLKGDTHYRAAYMQGGLSYGKGVRLSVRLSVTRVNCDKTNESSAEILIPYER